MRRKIAKMMLTSILFAAVMPKAVHAAGWMQDEVGWWYQNTDGSYPAATWSWIDGNQDGSAECYYFDENGYLLTDAGTPDGYQVNAEGKWIVNGMVQIQGVSVAGENTGINGRYADFMFDSMKGTEPEIINSDETLVRHYLEEQEDGSLLYTRIDLIKNYEDYADIAASYLADYEEYNPEWIENKESIIFQKTSENTYSGMVPNISNFMGRTYDWSYYYDLTVHSDGTIQLMRSQKSYDADSDHYQWERSCYYMKKAFSY